jgi:uncharacterized membrane protein
MATDWSAEHAESYTLGQRFADRVAQILGSWQFIIAQTIFVGGWILLNLMGWVRHWDPYPFILLNLLFSTQAAYAAPVIMMSQNRQADRDRYQAGADFETNRKAESEIEDMQADLARIEGMLETVLERLPAHADSL